MKTLIGGAVAAALGLIGLGFWWKEFLTVLGGTIPAVLLVGGGLAIYLGFDEMKDTWKKTNRPPLRRRPTTWRSIKARCRLEEGTREFEIGEKSRIASRSDGTRRSSIPPGSVHLPPSG